MKEKKTRKEKNKRKKKRNGKSKQGYMIKFLNKCVTVQCHV